MAIAGEEEDGQKAFSPQAVTPSASLPLLSLELRPFKSFIGRTLFPQNLLHPISGQIRCFPQLEFQLCHCVGRMMRAFLGAAVCFLPESKPQDQLISKMRACPGQGGPARNERQGMEV